MIEGHNMKERILRVLSDGQWHSSLEIALAVGKGGPAWSWDQRKNELIRDGGFHIERSIVNGHYYWKLLDPPEAIDFENCCLKKLESVQTTLTEIPEFWGE